MVFLSRRQHSSPPLSFFTNRARNQRIGVTLSQIEYRNV